MTSTQGELCTSPLAASAVTTALTTMTISVTLAWSHSAGGDVVCSCADTGQDLASMLLGNRIGADGAADALRAACVQAMPPGGAASAAADEAAASTSPSALMRAALIARASHTRLLEAASEQAHRLVAPPATDASAECSQLYLG